MEPSTSRSRLELTLLMNAFHEERSSKEPMLESRTLKRRASSDDPIDSVELINERITLILVNATRDLWVSLKFQGFENPNMSLDLLSTALVRHRVILLGRCFKTLIIIVNSRLNRAMFD